MSDQERPQRETTPTYTVDDVAAVIEYASSKSYCVETWDGDNFFIPYSAISDKDFSFLNPKDRSVITDGYLEKMYDVLVKYVNSGAWTKKEEDPIIKKYFRYPHRREEQFMRESETFGDDFIK